MAKTWAPPREIPQCTIGASRAVTSERRKPIRIPAILVIRGHFTTTRAGHVDLRPDVVPRQSRWAPFTRPLVEVATPTAFRAAAGEVVAEVVPACDAAAALEPRKLLEKSPRFGED